VGHGAHLNIGLIGDYNVSVPAHQAIPRAIELAAERLRLRVSIEWVPTEQIHEIPGVSRFDGLWCVPASPYRSMEGALRAIRFARQEGRAFLGTCGGFQHAVVEYARNALGWADAEHAETAPDADRAVISLLECSLVETADTIRLKTGSRLHQAYGCDEIVECYRCRYGLNERFVHQVTSGSLQATGHDRSGEVRVIELRDHPFFVATLFQPERAALNGKIPPLVEAFLHACDV
jgi:CTP synthase (UTP-ammonia lyase)